MLKFIQRIRNENAKYLKSKFKFLYFDHLIVIIIIKKVHPSAQNEVDKTAKKVKTNEKNLKKANTQKDKEQIDLIESETEQLEKHEHPRRNAFTKEVWASYENYTLDPSRKLHPCLLCQKRGKKVVSKNYF